MKAIKTALSFIGGIIATIAQQYGLILGFVCIVIIMDIVTGIMKVKASDEKLSSDKARRGFWKKLAYIAAFTFGIFIDFFIPSMLTVFADIALPFNCPFGLILGVYIVLNESISICENLYIINPVAVPQWLKPFFEKLTEKIESKEVEVEDKKVK